MIFRYPCNVTISSHLGDEKANYHGVVKKMIQTNKRRENIERDFLGELKSPPLKLDGKLKTQ